MQDDLERVLFDEAAILRRLDEIAAQITEDYRDRELTVIAVLNGSLIFMADLLRRIPLPLKLDCLSVASYHGGTKSTGEVIFRQVVLPDVQGRHILILDDILDSGLTLAAIRRKARGGKSSQRARLRFAGEENCPRRTGGGGLHRLRNWQRIRRRLRPRLHGALPEFALHRRPAERADRIMKVRVQFFSHLKDAAGRPSWKWTWPLARRSSDLLEQLYAEYPTLRAWDSSILIGAGMEFVERDHLLRPNEEIAIMPPVQGG